MARNIKEGIYECPECGGNGQYEYYRDYEAYFFICNNGIKCGYYEEVDEDEACE